MLRVALDQHGLHGLEIVVADSSWAVVNDLMQDPVLLQAVGVIG